MRIGIDLSFIRPDHTNGGGEQYILNLMEGLQANNLYSNYIFLVHEELLNFFKDKFSDFHFYKYQISMNHKVRMVFFQTFCIPRIVRDLKLDLIFFPSYQMGFLYKYTIKIPIVVTPHDIQFKYYPQYRSRFKLFYMNMGYKNAISNADKIICISKYVEKSLKQYYGKQLNNKGIVLYNPINFSYAKQKKPCFININYILAVSTIHKHKNMLTLVKAYELMKEKEKYQLVIVGAKGTDSEALVDYINKKHFQKNIIITGKTDEEELNWLYTHASLFVTSSLYEGFGMSPIEAMGAGVPVVSSRETSLPEVTKELCYYYEPANNEKELANVIDVVLHKNQNEIKLEEIKQRVIRSYSYINVSRKYNDFFLKMISKEI